MNLITEKTALPLSLVAIIILGTAYVVRLEARVDKAISVEDTVEQIREDVIDIKIHLGIPKRKK